MLPHGPRLVSENFQPHLAAFVADFLCAQRRGLEPSEKGATASFLFVVFGRPPQVGDDPTSFESHSPVSSFGYGAYPSAPEEWVEAPLLELFDYADHALRRD
jgi:hypothetical protein